MPDSHGNLTPDDKSTVLTWLQSRWTVAKTCPVSGHNDWMIGDHVVQPITISGQGAARSKGLGYPQVMLICDGCGYTMYFNAVKIGLGAPSSADQSIQSDLPPSGPRE